MERSRCAAAAFIAFERLLLERLAGRVATSPSLATKITWCRELWAAAQRIRALRRAVPPDVAAAGCRSLPDAAAVQLIEAWAALDDEALVAVAFDGVIVPFAIGAYARHASDGVASAVRAVLAGLRRRHRHGRTRRPRSIESSRMVAGLRRLAEHGDVALGACRSRMSSARTSAAIGEPARGRAIAALRAGEAREEIWFVGSPGDESRYLHQLVAFEINTFEAVSRHIAEFAAMPWEFHWDMACQIRDEVAHLGLWLGRLGRMGVRLGEHLLSVHEFSACAGHSLAGRLALLERLIESSALDSIDLHRCLWASRGDATMVAYFARVQLDEIGHVRCGNKWLRRLCEDDDELRRLVDRAEATSRERMLNDALRLERAGIVPPGNVERVRRRFDDPLQLEIDRRARLRAGFSAAEVAAEVDRRRAGAAPHSEEERFQW
ncbi:MAG TPA: DUF455 family protein [Candidatus Binatia bacterium]|jgi:hypothetical protein